MEGRNLRARDGSILVVCTANVCCSPYVERMLRARLAGTGIRVTSAGTNALVESEMDHVVARRLRHLGVSPDGFVARQLTEELVAGADVILGANRHHRSAVVQLSPAALHRTYAIADFSDIAAHLVGAVIPLHAGSHSFLSRFCVAAAQARGSVQARTSEAAAIIDPYGHSERAFEAMFGQVDHLLPPIIAALTGSAPEPVAVAAQAPAG